jgi:hypothetical protein
VTPQKEQRSAIRVAFGLGAGGSWPPTGEVATAALTVGVRMKVPLEVHEAPDLGAVHPQVGLHVGRRLVHGGKLNTQELGAPLQRGSHRPAEGRASNSSGVART